MSEQNSSRLHKLADAIAGERPQLKPEPVDHVRAAVESFVQQRDHIARLESQVRDNQITIARLDVELETRLQDLNECRRERDHYFEYSVRLVTQLNAADQLIRDALDMAKEQRIEPGPLIGEIRSADVYHDPSIAPSIIAEPLPPMPDAQDAPNDKS